MKPFTKAVLITTLIAGTLDILSAYVHVYILTGHISKTMFNYIASGALGPVESMKEGWGVIIMGIFFHYFIAFAFTLFFFLIYRKLKIGSINKYIAGVLYGLFVWLVMNQIVLPLSMLPARPFNLKNAIIGALILIFMIGLPISISAHNYFKKRNIF
ncbi:MAG: hypothetical protein ABIN97_15840 [Ginsengibacter sp.]